MKNYTVSPLPRPQEIRQHVLKQLEKVELEIECG